MIEVILTRMILHRILCGLGFHDWEPLDVSDTLNLPPDALVKEAKICRRWRCGWVVTTIQIPMNVPERKDVPE